MWKNKPTNLIFLVIIVCLITVFTTACVEDKLSEPNATQNESQHSSKVAGMQRVKLSSRADLRNLINDVEKSSSQPTRALIIPDYLLSDNKEPFMSLLEANRRELMSTLTSDELDILNNDEDDLEYCPSDSIIADIQFASLLNAHREIQVGDTVFKYLNNGVAYTDEFHADQLSDIEEMTEDITVTPNNVGQTIPITPNINFIPIPYRQNETDFPMWNDNDGISGGHGNPSGDNDYQLSDSSKDSNKQVTQGVSNEDGILLSNGILIPNEDIREVKYEDGGDGNWFHRFWTGLWGKNIVAIKKFSSNKKLTMNFYDQNYIIYSNIGTKLKMQKRVCGIWWNIKADNMIQGWETVTLKYTMPQPLPNNTFTYPGMTNPTAITQHSFPFSDEKIILFHIPFVDYDFKTKDVNKAFQNAIKKAFQTASKWAKDEVKDPSKIGLTCFNQKEAYIINGPYTVSGQNKRSIETKLFAKWFPCDCLFKFSVGTTVSLKDIKFSPNDGVELYRGRVFGAIYYKGKWLAARITKSK